jgi:hypothetical protein
LPDTTQRAIVRFAVPESMDYAAFCLPTQVWSASGPTRVPGDLPQPATQTLRPRDADARRTAIGAAVFSNFPLGAFGAPHGHDDIVQAMPPEVTSWSPIVAPIPTLASRFPPGR